MKSKYETHVLPRMAEIVAWCRDGVSEENIAHNLGVSYSSFNNYKAQHLELLEVLTRTRAYVDNVIVTGKLMQLVKGYDVVEPKETYELRGSGSNARMVLVKRENVTRHIAPNEKSIEFWLRNRCPDVWAQMQKEVNQQQESGVIMMPSVQENGDG